MVRNVTEREKIAYRNAVYELYKSKGTYPREVLKIAAALDIPLKKLPRKKEKKE